MRRPLLALLGVIAVITSFIPLAVQASTASAAEPARTASVTAGAGATLAARLSASSLTASRRITLPRQKCAALPDPATGCAVTETAYAARVSTTDSTAYWSGYMQACAVVYSTGGCNTTQWWVKDNFNFTTDFTTGQAWNNGTPSCTGNHTNWPWCSYTGNGTTTLQEGFNFGNGGWARMDITGNSFDIGGVIHHCRFRGPSWANVSGFSFDYASNVGDACPYIGT